MLGRRQDWQLVAGACLLSSCGWVTDAEWCAWRNLEGDSADVSNKIDENPKESTCEDDDEDDGRRDSCNRLSTDLRTYCVEPNEGDNESWCDYHGVSYSDSPCPLENAKLCEIPEGGDYTDVAVAYFYGVTNAVLEEECDNLGGTAQ